MKRLCFLAVLLALCSSASAAGSISFKLGGHRVHIESSRHCRSVSCASVSVSGVNGRSRSLSAREDVTPAKTAAPVPQTASPPPPPAPAPPAQAVVASPPAVYSPAASDTQIVAPPPAPPPVPQISSPLAPPPPPVAKPVEPVRAPAQVIRVSHDAAEQVSDSPIGDWLTEARGTVRIAKCGNALCGYVLDASSNDKGEAILINMKPKTGRQWSGSVYSQKSGETYYGTMAVKGINTLRVEACALGRFYCSGNNWSRVAGRTDSVVTTRQASTEPRS
jgi:hypothetical protein